MTKEQFIKELEHIAESGSNEIRLGNLFDLVIAQDRESRWISVKERLPEVDEETGRSESVLCIGWKGTHPDWIEYECMYFKRLDNPELMDRNGKPISFGWSKRWWDTNPDLFSIHFWQPLPEPPKL